jgi:hypothetical protein
MADRHTAALPRCGALLSFGGRAFLFFGVVMRWVAVLVFAAAISAPAEAALSTEELFNSLGLFGTWAVDCKREAGSDNPHVSVTMPGPGLILEDHDLGTDNSVNRYSILSAEKLSDTRIAVQVIFQPGKEAEERQRLVLAVRDGTRRTLFTQPQDGPVRVKEGVVAAYGLATPLLRKCE